jgi:predicted TIM-barrel fold metal-dependent hydrolase
LAGPWHWDPHERLRKMDGDGITAEVLFHGSQNQNPIPFTALGKAFLSLPSPGYADLGAEGMRIYNRWLADYCSVEPARHVGLAQIPFWDLDASVAEAEWVREAGVTGINFPSPRAGVPNYNDAYWEPFWSVCEDLQLSLNTHVASGGCNYDEYGEGPDHAGLFTIEVSWHSRRAIWFLIFGGVFERHPGLKLILTEQPGRWLAPLMEEMDSIYHSLSMGQMMRKNISRAPSDYVMQNVFIGASFMSRPEAETAVLDGLTSRYMWGSDFPHHEGTWPRTLASLHESFAGLPVGDIERILGLNAVEAFGLDGPALRALADRIGPEVAGFAERRPCTIPAEELRFTLAFRQHGSWS